MILKAKGSNPFSHLMLSINFKKINFLSTSHNRVLFNNFLKKHKLIYLNYLMTKKILSFYHINYLQKNIPWSFLRITYYYNNRPRYNTSKPTYFFTFGLLMKYLELNSRSLNKFNTKILIIFLKSYIYFPYYLFYFNYYSLLNFYFIRLSIKLYKFNKLFTLYPVHTNYFYKYKKQKSIKKWVKKKLISINNKN